MPCARVNAMKYTMAKERLPQDDYGRLRQLADLADEAAIVQEAE